MLEEKVIIAVFTIHHEDDVKVSIKFQGNLLNSCQDI